MLNRSTLDRLARLRAAIVERGDREAVLAEEGVSVETWLSWQREALAEGAQLFDHADDYCKVFEDPFSIPQPIPSSPASAPAPTSVSAPASAPAPTSVSAPASTAAPTPAPPTQVPARVEGPAPVPQVPSFMRFGPSVLRGPPSLPTPALAEQAPRGEAGPPSVESVEVGRAEARARPALGGHTIADEGTSEVRRISTAELKTPPTPFRALDPRANGITLQRLAEARLALAASAQEQAAVVLSSLGLGMEAYSQAEAYWSALINVDEVTRLEFARLTRQLSSRPPPPSSPQPAAQEGTGTVELNSVDLSEARLMRLSAPASSSAGVPSLSVEQYAWVYATLRRTRESGRADALARLRLTESQYQALELQWKAAMAANPPLKQAFLLALAKHTDTR
ncbi:MAG: hypothetical protein U0271_36065 [Polyangiaceae bacterium]